MRTPLPFLGLVLTISAYVALAACQQTPTDPASHEPGLTLAKGNSHGGGGGGGGGGASDPALVVAFSDRAGDGILSDGAPYEDGVCGVSATFNLTDVRLSLADLKGKELRDCGGSRTLFVDYDGDGLVDGSSGFLNVDAIQGLDSATPVEKDASFVTPECSTLKFHPGPATCDPSSPSCDPGSPAPGSDEVLAWQNPDGSWTIRTADTDGDGTPAEAYCETDGQLYSVPFEMTVRMK